MHLLIQVLKSLVFGIVQGITEWLPISSTGHLILLEKYMPLEVFSKAALNVAYWDMYKVVIQFGSILAVLLLYWHTLWPFDESHSEQKMKTTIRLWVKIVIASFPAAIAGFLLDDWIDSKMSTPIVIATTLILYGILFIVWEKQNHSASVVGLRKITYKKAFMVGLFQMLALIPGTSRSGSTILGASVSGFDRPTATQFSFYMAIPVMFGASLLKLIKMFAKGVALNFTGTLVLLVGMVTAFVVSVIVIRYLMAYIRKHSFIVFGQYRIVLGIIVLLLGLLGKI